LLRILLFAAASGLGIAAADVAVAIYPWSDHWRTWGAVMRTTPLILAASFVTFLLSGLVLRSAAKRFQRPEATLLDAAALAVFASFTAARYFGGSSPNARQLVLLAAVALVTFFLTVRKPVSALRLSLTGLAAATVTAAGWWVVYGLSNQSAAAKTSVFVASLGIVLWAWRLSSKTSEGTAAFLALSALSVALFAGLTAVASPSSYLQHVAVPNAAPPSSAPPILLLSIDTLRRDALSAYSPDAPPTPHLDALIEDSVRFDDALSSGSWTLPAVASFTTGLTAEEHRMSKRNWRIPLRLPRLAERLAAQGYVTAAAVDNGWARAVAGFDRGFQRFAQRPRETESFGSRLEHRVGMTTSQTLTWLASAWIAEHRSQPFFFWLHYFEPHGPYQPPVDLRPPGPPPAGQSFRFGTELYFDNFRARRKADGDAAPSPQTVAWARSLYEAEVRSIDREVGKLIAELRKNDLYDRMLIVLVSDHGEEFGEHGSLSHGFTTYPEIVRVPMAIKPPGGAPGQHVAAPVSTRRIFHTLLDAAGVSPAPCNDEPSLLALVGDNAGDHPLGVSTASDTLSGSYETALVFPTRTIVHDRDSDKITIYDRLSDPDATRPLTPSPEEAATITEQLQLRRQRSDYRRRCLGLDDEEPTPALDPRAVEKLRELGYIQ